MTISMRKFGYVLTSRQAGKEAYAAYLPTLKGVKGDETIIVDFEGVNTFSPSWGDEFLTPLIEKFGRRIVLKDTKNLSVRLTIETLEKIHVYKFRKISDKLYQCRYCGLSFTSLSKKKDHESSCPSNNQLSAKEKFDARLKLRKSPSR